jgi:hypothetical protein
MWKKIPASDPVSNAIYHKIMVSELRNDGSVMIDLDDEERGVFLSYVKAWRNAARQEISGDNTRQALAEFNSMNALYWKITENGTWSPREPEGT